MKIITKFKADVIEAEFIEGAGHHHHVSQSHQVKTRDGRYGIFSRSMRVGPAGLIFKAGEAQVALRLDELWRLVEQADERLKVPDVIEVPKAAGLKNPGETE